ncbi:universal stress protein [Desulfogranum japonicum]|uniref:universal stress protein n=1 Tax=Desulfogranum japonicum TaxID=231447 RepID=UPI0003F8F7A1|nr:universal stress protein [Desulfogranum japonicum]
MEWKRIIVAIDDSPMSENAVHYVGSMVGRLEGIQLCLLHIYPEPPPDFYSTGGLLPGYKELENTKAQPVLQKAQEYLQTCGISPESIQQQCVMAENKTISEAILALQTEYGYGTIVVGKRGISRSEEFLFGSISSALIHNGKDIAVWVIG